MVKMIECKFITEKEFQLISVKKKMLDFVAESGIRCV